MKVPFGRCGGRAKLESSACCEKGSAVEGASRRLIFAGPKPCASTEEQGASRCRFCGRAGALTFHRGAARPRKDTGHSAPFLCQGSRMTRGRRRSCSTRRGGRICVSVGARKRRQDGGATRGAQRTAYR